MTINFCDICNDVCTGKNTIIGNKNMDEQLRLLIAQVLCSLHGSLSEGAQPGSLISAATTNATVIKNAPGTLNFLTASNVNASPRYLKVYDKATAPTVGTDVPTLIFLIPGNTAGAGTNIPIPAGGIDFENGISFALTTGVAVADTGAVAANEIVVNYGYK